MRLVREHNVKTFAETVRPYLLRWPLEHSRLLTNIEICLRQRDLSEKCCSYWIADDHSDVAGVAVQTVPGHLDLSLMTDEVVSSLASQLSTVDSQFPKVSGPQVVADQFVYEWTRRTGRAHARSVALRMYRLGWLRPPSNVPGGVRKIRDSDWPLILAWQHTFMRTDVFGGQDHVKPSVQQQLALGARFVWVRDAKPVSTSGYCGPVAKVARIAPVYTPLEHRNQGYGSAITAVVSQIALARGAEEVISYADLSDHTTNSIYQRIGFEPFMDSCEYIFS